MVNIDFYNEVCERFPGVKFLAVTKYVGADEMNDLVGAGAFGLGENRVQDAERKFGELETLGVGRESFERHLIGHLQRNKVKKAVEVFDVIQSVDSWRLVEEIASRAEERGEKMRIYLQVNAADDEAKFGFGLDEVLDVAEKVVSLPSLELEGLMMIGRLGVSDSETRSDFLKMKKAFEEVEAAGFFEIENPVLSMGMSKDYELAIECGANMVRIGSILFK